SASVTGTGNQAVTWGATGSGNSITQNGLYTAGSTPGTFSVTARSVEDTTAVGSASVTVTAANPTLDVVPGHYHGGAASPSPPAPGVVPAELVQDCTMRGGVVLMQATFDYHTDTGRITGSFGINATVTPSGPNTLTGQSGNTTVRLTRRTNSSIILDLQGSQVAAAFCGEFTLAGIAIRANYALDSLSIVLNWVGP